ncbi:MAG: DMT family transporter [Desulfovibrionaceae bacterium]
MTTKTLGYLAALGATMVWSGNFVVARAIATDIPPIQLNFWRWVVALACLLPMALPHLRREWPVIRQHLGYLAFMALMGISLLNTLIYKGGQTTESLNMALLVPTVPIMIIILSRIFYGEAITPRRLLGVVVVLLGVLIIISRGDMQRLAAVRFAAGDFWALGGAACFAVYSLFVRQRPVNLSIESFNTLTFALGLMFMIPPLIWEMWVLPLPVLTVPVGIGILYSGVGCSFVSYMLWAKAISILGPVRAGFVYYTLPLFTAVAATMVLGEVVSMAHVLGGLCIIAGILVATVQKKP